MYGMFFILWCRYVTEIGTQIYKVVKIMVAPHKANWKKTWLSLIEKSSWNFIKNCYGAHKRNLSERTTSNFHYQRKLRYNQGLTTAFAITVISCDIIMIAESNI